MLFKFLLSNAEKAVIIKNIKKLQCEMQQKLALHSEFSSAMYNICAKMQGNKIMCTKK